MADYAAVPVQILAQGVLTIDAAGDPVMLGSGFGTVVRASVNPGDFNITLTSGVTVADIGSGQVLAINGRPVPGFGYSTGIVGPNGMDPRFVRVNLTMRGGTTAPGTTTITQRSVSVTTAPGTGALSIRVALLGGPGLDTPTDPMGPGAPNADGGGLEVMVMNGNAGPDNANFQNVGPLFQAAMQFP